MRLAWVLAAAAAGLVGCQRSASNLQSQTDGGALDKPSVDPHLGCDALPSRRGSAEARDALFAFLTANAWQGTVCATAGAAMLPPSCDRVSLESDGSFTWTTASDYLERGDKGTWSFEAHDDLSGTLFFSTGDAVLFRRDAETLSTSRVALVADASAGPRKGAGGANDLPAVEPPAMYAKLVGTCWKKTNDFDLYRTPDKLAFSPDGAFDAKYPFSTDGTLLASADYDGQVHLWCR